MVSHLLLCLVSRLCLPRLSVSRKGEGNGETSCYLKPILVVSWLAPFMYCTVTLSLGSGFWKWVLEVCVIPDTCCFLQAPPPFISVLYWLLVFHGILRRSISEGDKVMVTRVVYFQGCTDMEAASDASGPGEDDSRGRACCYQDIPGRQQEGTTSFYNPIHPTSIWWKEVVV